jgi:hypothetical protein
MIFIIHIIFIMCLTVFTIAYLWLIYKHDIKNTYQELFLFINVCDSNNTELYVMEMSKKQMVSQNWLKLKNDWLNPKKYSIWQWSLSPCRFADKLHRSEVFRVIKQVLFILTSFSLYRVIRKFKHGFLIFIWEYHFL